jgi:hypothetical protein
MMRLDSKYSMQADDKTLESRLIRMVRSSVELMDMLDVASRLKLASWCIGAGAVRSLVWDQLHGFAVPSSGGDVDVVYYDEQAGPEQDGELLNRLLGFRPAVRWEVTNQALVHHWFFEQHSQVLPPLHSLAEGIATWPEYATCVGVSLDSRKAIRVIAPHGLQDLFQLRVRHNPTRASAAVFNERLMSKQFSARWPKLSIIQK